MQEARDPVEAAHTAGPAFEILVVGAGPVGAALALALGRQGQRVALLDRGPLTPRWDSARIDPRVSAITPASQTLLTRLGAWPGVARRRLSPYEHMAVWDGEGTGRIDFSAAQAGAAVLGHIVENGALVDALLERLKALANVTLVPNARVEALSPAAFGVGAMRSVTLEDGRRFEAALVVGADGARSRIRALAGLGQREYATGQRGVVTTVYHRHDHRRTARQRFMASGPLAFLPLCVEGRQQVSSIVWSADSDRAETLLALDDQAFMRELEAGFELAPGDVTAVERRHAFALVQRHARRYVDEGVALVGDAAHSIHPLAGQGVNLGFMDVAVLCDEIERARRRGARPADERILARYARRRRGDNTLMLAMMDAFRCGFGATHPLLQVVRNRGLDLTGRSALARRFLIRQAMGYRGAPASLMQPVSEASD